MLFSKKTKTTYAEALKFDEEKTKKILTNILTDYIHQRIFWLLKDLGEKEYANQEIGIRIESFVEEATKKLEKNDAKTILLTLLANKRFPNKGEPKIIEARNEVVAIISQAMASINLGNPLVNPKTRIRKGLPQLSVSFSE